MKPLYKNKPKRLFTFGCSFTEWIWATWANILAYELDVPFYNFGKPGAGNYYIANQISQADAIFNFTKDDLVIVKSTIELGHNMGLKIVAEGVEDLESLEILRSLNCDYAQGFYLSKPMSFEIINQWISQNKQSLNCIT